MTGNDVRLTLDLKAQQAAYDALGGRCGAVVALDVKTGKLLVLGRLADVQPESGREATSTVINEIQAPCTPVAAALQPRDEGPLPAGIDLQGRDAVGRARIRGSTRRSRVRRSRLLRGVRQAGEQLRHDEPVRQRQPRPGAPATRSTPSSATSARTSAPRRSWRSRSSSASTSRRRSRRRRTSGRRAASTRATRSSTRRTTSRSIPAATPSARSGTARHADADGNGRGDDRERRRGDEAVRRRPDRLADRAGS